MGKLNIRSWRGFLLVVLLGFFFFYNFAIVQKERFLKYGSPVILALAPVDPRSLMQGDYMILEFALQNRVRQTLRAAYPDGGAPRKGRLVLERQNGEDAFKRLHGGEELAAGERLLEYTDEGRRIKIGGGSFFFEEGLARLYDHAVYAQVMVDSKGKAIISGLLDKDKKILSKARWDGEKRRLLEE